MGSPDLCRLVAQDLSSIIERAPCSPWLQLLARSVPRRARHSLPEFFDPPHLDERGPADLNSDRPRHPPENRQLATRYFSLRDRRKAGQTRRRNRPRCNSEAAFRKG